MVAICTLSARDRGHQVRDVLEVLRVFDRDQLLLRRVCRPGDPGSRQTVRLVLELDGLGRGRRLRDACLRLRVVAHFVRQRDHGSHGTEVAVEVPLLFLTQVHLVVGRAEFHPGPEQVRVQFHHPPSRATSAVGLR